MSAAPWELTTIIRVPADECPFCDGNMKGGQEPSTYYGPGEYYYLCGSCGAGEGSAFVEDFSDDADHPHDTPRHVFAHWVVTESAVEELREPYRTEAREGIAELGDEA